MWGGLEQPSSAARLAELGLSSLERSRVREGLSAALRAQRGQGAMGEGAGVGRERGRLHCMFGWTVRVLRHGNRLPREAVDALSLECSRPG